MCRGCTPPILMEELEPEEVEELESLADLQASVDEDRYQQEQD